MINYGSYDKLLWNEIFSLSQTFADISVDQFIYLFDFRIVISEPHQTIGNIWKMLMHQHFGYILC